MSDPLLELRDISWRAGANSILDGVSLEVRAGEFVGILGRNGAGKSTLLDIVAGLRTPSTGHVLFEGHALHQRSPRDRAQGIAHLPQSLRGDLAIRAESLVLMGRYVHASSWFESTGDRHLAEALMQRCHCWQFRDRLVNTLSGGERQRVFLAACLAQQPRLLLLDEPATFLDLDQQLECFAVLRDEARRGVACLAVTHDVNLAVRFCTRLIVLADRHVAFDQDAISALDAPPWLHAISGRLEVHAGADGRPWVGYR
jgi:iron complex transport system ATP-binding protein